MKKVKIVLSVLCLILGLFFIFDISNAFANPRFWLKLAKKYPNKAHIYLRRARREIEREMGKYQDNEIVSWDNSSQRIVYQGRITGYRSYGNFSQTRITKPDGTSCWTPSNKEIQGAMNQAGHEAERNQAFKKFINLKKQLYKFESEGNEEEARRIWREIQSTVMKIGRSSIRSGRWWRDYSNKYNGFGNKTPANGNISSSGFYASPQSVITNESHTLQPVSISTGTSAYFSFGN